MLKKALLFGLLILAAGGLVLVNSGRWRSAPPPPPPAGLSRVDLPPPRYSEVEGLRALKRPGSDRFQVEALDEAVERKLELFRPFLQSPPRDSGDLEARFPALGELFAATARALPLVPPEERRIRSDPPVEAFAGVYPSAPPPADSGRWITGALEIGKEVGRLVSPLAVLESAALKVVQLEGPPEGPESEVLYQFAGQEADGRRRQWNGRWRLRWTEGWRIAELRPLEATRVVLSSKPFEDVSAAALAANASYAAQLFPGIDYFRDRLDAATGIEVYGHHGIAAGDADGDGLEDVYLPEPGGLPNLLLRNRGDGRFEDLSRGSGADLLDPTSQALFLDLDSDGDQDLFLVCEDGPRVLQNDGPARFAAHPERPHAERAARSTAICAAAADYDLDGAVDVYVGAYVFWRGTLSGVASRLPFPYHDARNGAPNYLLKNRGDGAFSDTTRASGLDEGNDRFTFAAAWGDYQDDGYPDLAVANDFGRKNLYQNLRDGTFRDVAEAAGASDLGAGMSVAWEDYDGDARLDLYFGNMFSTAGLRVTGWPEFKQGSALRGDYQKHARGNTLLWNRGDGTFEDRSLSARAFLGRWAWSSDFLDFDLDGRQDLYVANGFVTNSDRHDL